MFAKRLEAPTEGQRGGGCEGRATKQTAMLQHASRETHSVVSRVNGAKLCAYKAVSLLTFRFLRRTGGRQGGGEERQSLFLFGVHRRSLLYCNTAPSKHRRKILIDAPCAPRPMCPPPPLLPRRRAGQHGWTHRVLSCPRRSNAKALSSIKRFSRRFLRARPESKGEGAGCQALALMIA